MVVEHVHHHSGKAPVRADDPFARALEGGVRVGKSVDRTVQRHPGGDVGGQRAGQRALHKIARHRAQPHALVRPGEPQVGEKVHAAKLSRSQSMKSATSGRAASAWTQVTK